MSSRSQIPFLHQSLRWERATSTRGIPQIEFRLWLKLPLSEPVSIDTSVEDIKMSTCEDRTELALSQLIIPEGMLALASELTGKLEQEMP